MSQARPLGEQYYNQNVEASLDELALRSRYTPAPIEEHPETIEQVADMLDGLTEAQREAAELIGMASLNGHQAAELVGKHPQTVRMAWYRAVEKFTGETPPPLDRWRERKRRNYKPRQRKEDPVSALERNRRWRQNLYRIERETGETPPALAALRERKREQRRKSREAP